MRKVNIFVQIWFLRMLLSLRTGEAKIITCPIIILLGVLVLIFSAGLVFQEVIHLSLHALPLSNHLKTSLRKIETLSSSEFQWNFLKNVISFWRRNAKCRPPWGKMVTWMTWEWCTRTETENWMTADWTWVCPCLQHLKTAPLALWFNLDVKSVAIFTCNHLLDMCLF